MRKTKIIATLGPATESPEMIGRLAEAGVDVFRLNMSHGPHDWTQRVVTDIRKTAQALGKALGILMDTQGPSIRTGDLPAPLSLTPGQKFALTVRGETSEGVHSVDVNYENFINDISLGDVVLIDNGEIQMRVLAKSANKVECEVLTPGVLGSRRHINLPGVKVSLPPLTDKDKADVALGLELAVDFIALSFVRAASDIAALRELTAQARRKPLIIAKIEDQQAVEHLEAILRESDGAMVARGDLGIEIPYEELPIVQRRIVKACQHLGRPVIVATHMLESMIDNPVPTRAEITDIANAVFEQADAIMLSGETTVGRYPVQCVEVFKRIAARIERSGGANYHENALLTSPRQKLVKSAVVMADQLKADGIVVFTLRGNMAKHTSWLRPRYSPIFAICDRQDIAEELALYRGVTPLVVPFQYENPVETISRALAAIREKSLLPPKSTIVLITSMDSGEHLVDAVQMRHLDY